MSSEKVGGYKPEEWSAPSSSVDGVQFVDTSPTNPNLHEEATFRLLEEDPRGCLHFVMDMIGRGEPIPEDRMQRFMEAIAQDKTAQSAHELYVFLVARDYPADKEVLLKRILKKPAFAGTTASMLEERLSQEILDKLLSSVANAIEFEDIEHFFRNSRLSIATRFIGNSDLMLAMNEHHRGANEKLVRHLKGFTIRDADKKIDLLNSLGKLSSSEADIQIKGHLTLADVEENLSPASQGTEMAVVNQDGQNMEDSLSASGVSTKNQGFLSKIGSLFSRKNKKN